MDGRRHSVDVPISRTLVALRRVRSLRDPSTNSLSKFSPLVENLNWDTNSNNGIALGFERKYNECVNIGNEQDLYGGNLRKSVSKLVSHENGNKGSDPSLDMFCGNKSLSERYYSSYRDKGLDLACITPSGDCLEGEGSCNELNVDCEVANKPYQYRKQVRSSKPAAGDILSRSGSPCLSMSDAAFRVSGPTSLNGNEDTDALDFSQCGCGISRCWSKTPRLRGSQYQMEAEDHPLLLGGVEETLVSERRRGCNHMDSATCLCSESPRSLGQKFMPRSFSELVGQDVVAKSLLSAVSSKRISSFYLFHGPRGTGKTSAARIFAATLNCVSQDMAKPCGSCRDCVLFFSGKGRDIKEVDSLKVNRTQRIRAIIKNAENSPCSSRFKVIIIDECHLLQEESWATFLNSIEELSRHVVFIMITPDLHKLPRAAVSRSHRYNFLRLKEVDITGRLENMCVEEGFSFDRNALEFVAAKSNGSLREAEMMLEQSSLIGKKITLSLVYELMGVVSDEELLDLLHLALSSNTPDTVKRARELMRSRIDPLQLISQLATFIMDILAGKCQGEASDVQRKLFGRSISEADIQQLSQALKILSETEKQLRMSKNQTTWLTAALLQLSSVGSYLETGESRLCSKSLHPNDGEFYSTSSTSENFKHPLSCTCNGNNSCKTGVQDRAQTLDSVWRRAAAECESSSLKNFLQKHGKLLSIRLLKQGLAVAELGFFNPKYVCKAEKQWKAIAGGLQLALGHNVEIRISLILDVSAKDNRKVKKPYFGLFSCSRRSHHRPFSATESGSDPSDISDFSSTKAFARDKNVETGSSESGSHSSRACCLNKQIVRTIRSSEGNALSIALSTPNTHSGAEYLEYGDCEGLHLSKPEKQPGCFPRTLKLQKLKASNANETVSCRSCLEKNPVSSVPQVSSHTYSHATDPGVPCCMSDNY